MIEPEGVSAYQQRNFTHWLFATNNENVLRAHEHDPPRPEEQGPRAEHVKRMLRTAASILDSKGTLRNRASLAHPNEELLDADEARLVINLARSLLRFLDAKLMPTPVK